MNGLLYAQGLNLFSPDSKTKSALNSWRKLAHILWVVQFNYRCDYFNNLQRGHQLNSLEMTCTWSIPEVQILANWDLCSTKVFWTPCQHRSRQIRIQEPILAVHLYLAGQYSIHKITPDNDEWWHELTNFWMRHQRSECKKSNAVKMVTLG